MLARLIGTQTRLQGRVVRAVAIDDIPLLYTDFAGTTVDPSGTTSEVQCKAIEVLRRQPAGTGKLLVGDPNARA